MKHFALFIIIFTCALSFFPGCKKDKITGSIPVITLVGNNPVNTGMGYSYSDAGAIATDNEDGNITSAIIVSDNVDSSATGTYYVNYNVTDKDGNKAKQVRRTVNVLNTR